MKIVTTNRITTVLYEANGDIRQSTSEKREIKLQDIPKDADMGALHDTIAKVVRDYTQQA